MGTSIIVFLALILVGVAAAALVLRSNKQRPKKDVNTGAKKQNSSQKFASNSINRYRATAIICNENACEAVKVISGKRFFDADKDIPQIPLPNCDTPKCSCKYERYLDRRVTDEIRRAPPGLKSQLHPHIENVERRLKRGRRTSDWD
jgi:hypothetical protein